MDNNEILIQFVVKNVSNINISKAEPYIISSNEWISNKYKTFYELRNDLFTEFKDRQVEILSESQSEITNICYNERKYCILQISLSDILKTNGVDELNDLNKKILKLNVGFKIITIYNEEYYQTLELVIGVKYLLHVNVEIIDNGNNLPYIDDARDWIYTIESAKSEIKIDDFKPVIKNTSKNIDNISKKDDDINDSE